MKMEIDMISMKSVKPSSSSSSHPKTFILSLLDRRIPPIYAGFTFFYAAPSTNNSHFSSTLQNSLSKILVHFYPLAGSLNEDGCSVDCNDHGACFVKARIPCRLADFLSKPNHDLLNALTPVDDYEKSKFTNSLILVQLTCFTCGGLALSAFTSHKICDAMSLWTLIKAWTVENRNDHRNINFPKFIEGSRLSRSEFPNVNMPIQSGKNLTRRFVFDAIKIAMLKRETRQHQPSRVEVVLALIIRRAMVASRLLSSDNCSGTAGYRHALLFHLVNYRNKLVPPLSSNTMGNVIWSIPVTFREDDDDEMELSNVVGNIRKCLSYFNNEQVQRLQSEQSYSKEMDKSNKEKIQLVKNSKIIYKCLSLCQLPFYEADFGWGKPIWVTSANNGRNTVKLLDTKIGDGIEAWVTLKEQEMKVFECDEEILAFASLNPSIISNPSRL